MYTFIIIVHLFVCFILIGIVLLQAGKGAEMGAAFGGSSQTIFGSRGATTFLSKVTVGAAVLFMVTSLSLSILSRERSVVPTAVDSGREKEAAAPQETQTTEETESSPAASTSESEGGASSEGAEE
ncbi:MAG: preprotein translocase subunit SecG [Nitrospiria bacterium]